MQIYVEDNYLRPIQYISSAIDSIKIVSRLYDLTAMSALGADQAAALVRSDAFVPTIPKKR